MSFGTCITARVSVRSLEVMSLIGLPAPTLAVHQGVSEFDSERLRIDESGQDSACDASKQRLRTQRQPTSLIGEIEEKEEFTRRIDDGREADFRLEQTAALASFDV